MRGAGWRQAPWQDALVEPRLVRFEGFQGIHLVADVRGDDDAWPVLLMHGGGQTRHAWGNTASTLAEQGWKTIPLAVAVPAQVE